VKLAVPTMGLIIIVHGMLRRDIVRILVAQPFSHTTRSLERADRHE
jgi:hypothetical protein